MVGLPVAVGAEGDCVARHIRPTIRQAFDVVDLQEWNALRVQKRSGGAAQFTMLLCPLKNMSMNPVVAAKLYNRSHRYRRLCKAFRWTVDLAYQLTSFCVQLVFVELLLEEFSHFVFQFFSVV